MQRSPHALLLSIFVEYFMNDTPPPDIATPSHYIYYDCFIDYASFALADLPPRWRRQKFLAFGDAATDFADIAIYATRTILTYFDSILSQNAMTHICRRLAFKAATSSRFHFRHYLLQSYYFLMMAASAGHRAVSLLLLTSTFGIIESHIYDDTMPCKAAIRHAAVRAGILMISWRSASTSEYYAIYIFANTHYLHCFYCLHCLFLHGSPSKIYLGAELLKCKMIPHLRLKILAFFGLFANLPRE